MKKEEGIGFYTYVAILLINVCFVLGLFCYIVVSIANAQEPEVTVESFETPKWDGLPQFWNELNLSTAEVALYYRIDIIQNCTMCIDKMSKIQAALYVVLLKKEKELQDSGWLDRYDDFRNRFYRSRSYNNLNELKNARDEFENLLFELQMLAIELAKMMG